MSKDEQQKHAGSFPSAALDLYLWLTYHTFGLKRQLRLSWPQLYRQFGRGPGEGEEWAHC